MSPIVGLCLGLGTLGAGFALGAWFWRVVVVPRSAPELKVSAQLVAVYEPSPECPAWVLAFYDDGTGLWGLGRSREEAVSRALSLWHHHTPGEARCADEEWVRGLRLVLVVCSSETLKDVVLPLIRDAEFLPDAWVTP